MDRRKEEFISLRGEMIQLASAMDHIINILYVFITPFLSFALSQKDTIYILMSHIVVFPAYLLVIGKRMSMCKISAYIKVYYDENGWAPRTIKFKTKIGPKIYKYIDSYHFPFILINLTILFLYINRTSWECSIYELIKLMIEILFFTLLNILSFKNRKISSSSMIDDWEKIKISESIEI